MIKFLRMDKKIAVIGSDRPTSQVAPTPEAAKKAMIDSYAIIYGGTAYMGVPSFPVSVSHT